MQMSFLKQNPWKSILYIFCVLALLGVFATLTGINLENQVIMAYDEARHGVSAYEMIRNDDWLIHTYQDEPDFWNLKPPFSFWAIALNFKLFGYHSVALRLHSAIATAILLLWITLWAKKRYGIALSLLMLLFLVINPALYGQNFARRGEADAMHTLFFTISMLCLLNSKENFRWLYGSAFGFGLSFMTKSYHSALIPLICFLFLLCTGEIRKLTWRRCLWLIFWGFLPIAPWAIARYLREGPSFFIEMIVTDIFARVSPEHTEPFSWTFYLFFLQANHTIFVCLWLSLGAVVLQCVKKRRFFLSRSQILLLLWIAVPLVLYSFSSFKLYHYILPITIPFSIAGALASRMIFRHIKPLWIKSVLALLLAIGMIFQLNLDFQAVLAAADTGSLQASLIEALDRDLDGGKHIYIQYDKGRTVWMQNDMLRSLLSGDVICIDGGIEAFVEDEEPSLLVIFKSEMDYDLLEENDIYYDSTYYYILENGY